MINFSAIYFGLPTLRGGVDTGYLCSNICRRSYLISDLEELWDSRLHWFNFGLGWDVTKPFNFFVSKYYVCYLVHAEISSKIGQSKLRIVSAAKHKFRQEGVHLLPRHAS